MKHAFDIEDEVRSCECNITESGPCILFDSTHFLLRHAIIIVAVFASCCAPGLTKNEKFKHSHCDTQAGRMHASCALRSFNFT